MRLTLVVLIWLSLVGYRFFHQFQAGLNLGHWENKEISITGRISSEPILQGNSQKFKVSRFDIVTKSYPKYEYGQKVAITGRLQRRLINKWYSQFRLIYPNIQLVKADNTKTISLSRLRQRIEGRYNRLLPEPEASLLAGIVLGSKKGLPKDFYQALQKTGTLHIVVASGYNVTIIIVTLMAYLAGLLKRQWAVLLGLLAVGLYTLMAGAEPAIVRAAIMGSLVFLGQIIGRKTEGLRLLIAAVMIMLLVNPSMVFDVGFQLSVAATFGLIVLAPRLEPVLGRVWLIGKDLTETTSAQIMVWPLIAVYFGQMSVFSIVVNSLILWLVPIIMSLGALLALTGNQLVGWLTYVPLTIMVRVIEWFGNVL
ncbi:MAG: ComEC/Rec2-related protein [Candidatus Beckwithbacteria bacterium GW2011_GWA2_43_10]|uniref:ComEC/Rec2-related protein n=1 Tax=Candidatus Beckwithbacteria bacterium GW2011_GWA2_43_10 TaxID=1618369 RepID=A0A0G1F033_9BACT|nr:MAG: ComEC/Rec2-related protein [Candidatus Beckwithbacteria bacterium GW2011_GWA2_43_10]